MPPPSKGSKPTRRRARPCFLPRFDSREEAEAELHRLQGMPAWMRPPWAADMRSVYRCWCGVWHLGIQRKGTDYLGPWT
jgi:hypothetical protein